MANYLDGIIDIAMSSDGDLQINNGDLKLHSGIDWLISEIEKIAKTNNPDWVNHPNVGANIEDYIGQTNSREVASSIQKRLYDAITKENIQFPGKLEIKVVPLSVDNIAIYISVSFGDDNIPLTKVIFDYSKGAIQSTQIEENYFTRVEEKTNRALAKNPYLARIIS